MGARGALREVGGALDARKAAALQQAGDQGVAAARIAKPDALSGKRTVAPSGAVTRNKQLLEEAIQQGGLTYDDLTPEQKDFFNNFKESSFSRALTPEDRYVVGRLKAMEATDDAARAAATTIADEAFDEIDDRVAQSLLTRAQGSIPEGARGIASQMKGLARGAASRGLEAAKFGVRHPGQVLKGAGRGALAAGSLMPDPTDLAMIAASAPYLGLHELGARKDFAAQLDMIAPEHSAGERPAFEADQLSERQKADIREFVFNAPHPTSAARLLIHDRKYITPAALDEIIQ